MLPWAESLASYELKTISWQISNKLWTNQNGCFQYQTIVFWFVLFYEEEYEDQLHRHMENCITLREIYRVLLLMLIELNLLTFTFK